MPTPGAEHIAIKLDGLESLYGSPVLDDVEHFAKAFRLALDQAALPADPSTEVSSPGAERLLKLPDELERFKGLPMRVCYGRTLDSQTNTAVANTVPNIDVLTLVSNGDDSIANDNTSSSITIWNLADVRVNWRKQGKKQGQRLNKKERQIQYRIPLEQLHQVNLHVDI